MAVDISVQLHTLRWRTLLRPYCKTVRMACAAALPNREGAVEMAVVLADDAFIRELNRTYRGKDRPTNVLSFHGDDAYLGDIVLALETIEREALEQKKSFKNHAVHLLVHGTLHLLGHDHEEEKAAQKMEKMEIKILKKLGVSNPYLLGHS